MNAATGVNTVTVTATAMLPTTFMSVANVNTVTVASTGEATRRMVDLSLVLDVSSSIGPQWSAVRDAARAFVNSFDAAHDRLALLTFGDGAKVLDRDAGRAAASTRPTLMNDVPSTLPGGSTAMVEGLYRGWDELRSVPAGSQSGLRVIVLFTDGASNSVPGDYGSGPGVGLSTYDFPQNPGDTFGQTWNSPHITGLYDTQTRRQLASASTRTVPWNSTNTPFTANNAWPKYLPVASAHTHHRSAGIPTSFPLQTNALTVDGCRSRPPADCGTSTPRRTSIRPRSTTSTTPRATSSRSSPTPRATTPATTTSASTRSAWASWCRCSSAPGWRRPRAS